MDRPKGSARASRPRGPLTLIGLLRKLGPGFITGTSDDDPSAIATYSQTGAQFGLTQLWTALFTWPMMSAIQEMCGRIGAVTGLGLSAVIRRHYAKPVLYGVVFTQVIVNTVNVGADLGGMAQSCQLLWSIPYLVWLAIATAVTVLLMVLVRYHTYAWYLRFVGLTLLSYVAAAATIHVDWGKVLYATFVPTFRLQKDFLLSLVGVLGTTISPYEFFWQSHEEVEELIDQRVIGREGERPPEHVLRQSWLNWLRWDTTFGMFVSNLVMYFIIVVTAFTLAPHGITNINTATDAAQALRPLAGPATYVLFTLGIVSAGLISIPVMAGSSAYAMAGAFDWPGSLAKPPAKAPAFYAVIVGTALLGVLLTTLLPVPPFKLLFYAAVLNGIVAPFKIFIVMTVARDPRIMGRFTNSIATNALGWILFALMTVSLIALIAFWGGS